MVNFHKRTCMNSLVLDGPLSSWEKIVPTHLVQPLSHTRTIRFADVSSKHG